MNALMKGLCGVGAGFYAKPKTFVKFRGKRIMIMSYVSELVSYTSMHAKRARVYLLNTPPSSLLPLHLCFY